MTRRLDEAVKRERKLDRKRRTIAARIVRVREAPWNVFRSVLLRGMKEIAALNASLPTSSCPLPTEMEDRHFYREEIAEEFITVSEQRMAAAKAKDSAK